MFLLYSFVRFGFDDERWIAIVRLLGCPRRNHFRRCSPKGNPLATPRLVRKRLVINEIVDRCGCRPCFKGDIAGRLCRQQNNPAYKTGLELAGFRHDSRWNWSCLPGSIMQIGVETSRAVENKRVFVIDSDEIDRAVLQFMLHDENETHELASLVAAFAKARDWKPDLVLVGLGIVRESGV